MSTELHGMEPRARARLLAVAQKRVPVLKTPKEQSVKATEALAMTELASGPRKTRTGAPATVAAQLKMLSFWQRTGMSVGSIPASNKLESRLEVPKGGLYLEALDSF